MNEASPHLLDRVRRALPALTEAERRVAHALMENYPVAGLETVAKLAERAKTSGPTILRFVARLGFRGFAEFQSALHEEIAMRLQGPLARYPETDRRAAGSPTSLVSEALARNVEETARGLDPATLREVVAALVDPERRLLFLGGRFSGMLAAYFQAYVRELRSGTRLVDDLSGAAADHLLDLSARHTLVVFDFRRYQDEVLTFARAAAGREARIVLVTDIWYSPIAALAQHVLVTPVRIPSAFDSGLGGLALVEMIVACMVEEMGGAAKDRHAALEGLRARYGLGG